MPDPSESQTEDKKKSRPTAEEITPPSPDSAGPHDVPDEKVIEKTLPTTSNDDSDGSAPASA
jgi:hypothetical protein